MSKLNRLRVEALEAREVPAGDLAYAFGLTGLPFDSLTRVVTDGANNTYVAGSFSGTVDFDPSSGSAPLASKGGKDVFVAKYGPTGGLVWVKGFGGTGDDTAADIALDGASNVYIGGTFNKKVDFNPSPTITQNLNAAAGGSAFIEKLTTNGDFVMARAPSGVSTLTALAVTPNGAITAVGQFSGTVDLDPGAGSKPQTAPSLNGQGSAGYVMRLDPLGAHVWSGAIASTKNVELTAVTVDQIGSVYVGGRATGVTDLNPMGGKFTLDGRGMWTPFITKLTSSGAFAWARAALTYKAAAGAPNKITGLAVDGSANVIAAGVFAGTLDFDQHPNVLAAVASRNQGIDGFAWKLNANGALAWAKAFGGKNAETVRDVAADSAGNVYMVGTFQGSADFDPGYGTVQLISPAGQLNAYVLKLNALGGVSYARALGGGSSAVRATGVDANSLGQITVTGAFTGKGDFNPDNQVQALTAGPGGSVFVARLTPASNASVGPLNLPPRIQSVGGPYIIQEGKVLTLKAVATDNSAAKLTYSWDLNGDGVFTDATGQTATVTPAKLAELGLDDAGGQPISVRLRVTDGVNLPVEAGATVTVKNQPPGLTVTAPATAVEGVPAIIKVAATGTPAEVAAGFKYSFDFDGDGNWDVGDGTTYEGSVVKSQIKVPVDIADDSGELNVKVRVFDKDGAYTDKTVKIAVANVAPTATFKMIGTPIIGQPTTFKLAQPVDVEGDLDAGLTYGFDFNNDGVYEKTGTSQTATHVFSTSGDYTVRGMVMDKDGGFTEYALTFSVSTIG
ncbi:MAG TPA: PKD domain-containing protein [Gemmataceae bacterium]|nr:PKD domain-containing protein [Gemmataceae bacterium]